MTEKKNSTTDTLKEILLGIVFFTAVCQLVGMWFVPNMAGYAIGLWLGGALACFCAVHMNLSLQRNLNQNGNNEKAVQTTAIRSNLLRYAAVVIVFLIICITDFAEPLAAFLGIMGLKAGAYLQPLIHRILKKRR